MDWLRRHVLGWATSAAATLTALQLVAPPLFDWVLNVLVVGLVALAAKLAQPRA